MTETPQGGPVRFHQQGPWDIPWQNGPDVPIRGSKSAPPLPASASIGGNSDDRPRKPQRLQSWGGGDGRRNPRD